MKIDKVRVQETKERLSTANIVPAQAKWNANTCACDAATTKQC